MIALVSFSFAGGLYDNKLYAFKTEVKNLNKYDLVIVEGVKPNTENIAIFLGYREVDNMPEMERKMLLRKAHGNTVKSLVNKRHKAFLNVAVNKGVYKMLKNHFPELKDLSEEEVDALLFNRITVAPARKVREKQMTRYFYKDMQINFKENEQMITQVLKDSKKVKWRDLSKLEKYLNGPI